MKAIITVILGITILFSCQKKEQKENKQEVKEAYEVKYAQVFGVAKYNDYTLVTVKDPWDSSRILQKYILVDKKDELPSNLPQGTVVRTPIETAAVYSTIHCAVLRELNSLNIIKAVCEPEYIDDDYVKEGIKSNTIINLGLASNPDIEKLILTNPEAVITSPIQGVSYGSIEKTGIPIIEIPDYMESTPLGRAEWIRLYSLFIGKEQMGDSIFQSIEKQYNKLKSQIASSNKKPSVFTDLKYGNTWYIAGGESFIGNLLKDAGAHYIWADDKSTGANPFSFETVLDKAGEADIWLIKYNQAQNMTFESLKKEFTPYSYFKAYKEKNIYTCNTGKLPYYETIAIHPEKILKDFACIFHPELFSNYNPAFYTKMTE